MSEGEASFYGTEAKTALRWRAINLFREHTPTMEVIINAVVVLGDSACDWGWHKLTLVPKSGGEAIVKRSRYCEIWRRSQAGQWQIRTFMDNKDHEPAMLPEEAIASANPELIVA